MARSKLPLPDSTRTQFYRALETKLRSFPDLKRVVKKWRFYSGDADDTAPPDINQTPWLRMRPSPRPGSLIAQNSTLVPVSFSIETVVEGTNVDDLQNLWAAIERALFAGDGTTLTLLNTFNATGLVLSQEGVMSGVIGDNKVLAAQGSITANMIVDTSL